MELGDAEMDLCGMRLSDFLDGVKPDHEDLQGGYTITFAAKIRNARGIHTRTFPALSITGAAGLLISSRYDGANNSCDVRPKRCGPDIHWR